MKSLAQTIVNEQPAAARDPRIDAYIAKSGDYAQPILAHPRALVQATCPEVEETLKWSMSFFDYRGSPLCNLAALKAHCSLGFWRAKELPELPRQVGEDGMGNLGRITSLADLPAERTLRGFIKAAMKLNEVDRRPARPKIPPKAALTMPAELADALRRNPQAQSAFDAFVPGSRRGYIEWIVEAKRDATRASRFATAIEWIADGKTRHWKYKT